MKIGYRKDKSFFSDITEIDDAYSFRLKTKSGLSLLVIENDDGSVTITSLSNSIDVSPQSSGSVTLKKRNKWDRVNLQKK